MIEKISDANLRVYIIWLPVLRSGAHEPAARREAGRIPDGRAMRFFDPEAEVGKLYSGILRLAPGLPAWDVYLVFGPEVRWQDGPPEPTYWMHQLGRAGPSELRLDGEQLRRVVNGLLAARERSPSSQQRSRYSSAKQPIDMLAYSNPSKIETSFEYGWAAPSTTNNGAKCSGVGTAKSAFGARRR